MIPGFLLGLTVQFTTFPYLSRAAFICYSFVSDLKPPIKAIKFYLDANVLNTKILDGLTSRFVLNPFKALSPA
jgi:hypothetical protein